MAETETKVDLKKDTNEIQIENNVPDVEEKTSKKEKKSKK